MNRSPIITQFL